MRSSAIVLAALSALATAAPFHKRAYVTDLVVELVTVTVTEGQPLPTHSSSAPVPTTTSTPPVVIPTTTPTPEPVVPQTTPGVFIENAPSPTPTPEPAPVAASTPEDAAPVVVASTPVAVAAAPEETSAAAPAPSPAGNDYKSTVLYHHNVHRANHSASALTYDDTLASYAAQVAASCVFAHDLSPGGGGYGQNIADAGSTGDESSKDPGSVAAGAISNQWYNGELPLFDPSMYGEANPDMSNFEGWGHFTQVVWKGTTTVGCATQFCGSGTQMFSAPFSGWYTVCNYGSPGNVGGEYGTNVGRPLGQLAVVPS